MYHVCVVEVVHPCTSRAACYFGCLPIMPLFHAAPQYLDSLMVHLQQDRGTSVLPWLLQICHQAP